MGSMKGRIGQTYPLQDAVQRDGETGAVIHRFIHRAPAREQIFYYCSPAITRDGRYIPCWSDVSGSWQIHALDRQENASIQLSALERGDIQAADHPCLSREYSRVFYNDSRTVFWTALDGRAHGTVFEAPEGYRVEALSARGRYLAFAYTEECKQPRLPGGREPRGRPNLYYRPRSIVFAVDIEAGTGDFVWGDQAYLGHVEMCPFDDNLVMFVDQSVVNRQQEVFLVGRAFAEDKQAHQVLAGNFPDYRGRTMDYIGHSFFTQDGFIAGQYFEMGGVDARNGYTDRSSFNLVIRPDGTLKRKAKYPGQKCPCHVHCQRAAGLWVGDHWIREDGTPEMGWLSLIRNAFETQELRSWPLARTNHHWERPWHPHAWLSDDEDFVVCAFNTGAGRGENGKGTTEDNHMALIEIPEALRKEAGAVPGPAGRREGGRK